MLNSARCGWRLGDEHLSCRAAVRSAHKHPGTAGQLKCRALLHGLGTASRAVRSRAATAASGFCACTTVVGQVRTNVTTCPPKGTGLLTQDCLRWLSCVLETPAGIPPRWHHRVRAGDAEAVSRGNHALVWRPKAECLMQQRQAQHFVHVDLE
jgi:hypothetical protein